MNELLPLSAKDYHADKVADVPSLSSSIAHTLISRSARHAYTEHPKLNPYFQRVEKDKFDVGTVAHAILLEGADIVEMVDAPDWRTKAAQEARDAARRAGKVPLLPHQLTDVHAMVEAATDQILAHEAKPQLLAAGKAEGTLVWQDDHGVICRARPDWLHDDLVTIDDYKTTSGSADPHSWTRNTMFAIGADIQAAFYLRGLRKLTGPLPGLEFRFIVQETYPPYALSVVALSPDAMALAEDKVKTAIAMWAKCLDTGKWPAYPTRVCYAEDPGWQEAQWLQRRDAA